MRKKMLFVSCSAPNKLNPLLKPFEEIYNVSVIYKMDEYIPYYNENHKIKRRFLNLLEKIGIPYDYGLNKRIENHVRKNKTDIIFIVKGNEIMPSLLRRVRNDYADIKLVNWSLDNMYKRHNRSSFYTRSISLYDLVVTTKIQNLHEGELQDLGARDVQFVYQAYDKDIHKPCQHCSNVDTKHNILFVGCAEIERFNAMNYLAKKGFIVDVYGSGWDRGEFQDKHENLVYHYCNLLNEDYANAISCSKISLCFLRKINNDTHTSRSVEIPACGGFMLAERTDEHKKLFIEGVESEYFDSNEELLSKVEFYLKNDRDRKKIALSGFKRCAKEEYSYHNMAKKIFERIENIF